MTEDEAKTRWCPMYRQSVAVDGLNREWADNRMDGSNPTCIASACMAWRWEDDDAYEQRVTEWEDAANIGGVQRGPEPERRGFCGLVGKP